jgi:hypothetical protein
MKTFILAFTFIIAFTSCSKSQSTTNTDSLTISKSCLAELISSTDEVECFAFYFDTKPEVVKANLNHFRIQYCSELRDAGWNPQSPFDLINFRVPFDQNGNLITWEQFKKLHSIDNDTPEKRTYHYEIEED